MRTPYIRLITILSIFLFGVYLVETIKVMPSITIKIQLGLAPELLKKR